jgi:hypothetical protein
VEESYCALLGNSATVKTLARNHVLVLCVVFLMQWLQLHDVPDQSSKLLMALPSTVVFGFEPRRDTWPNSCSFQGGLCLEMRFPLLREEEFVFLVGRSLKLLLTLANTVIPGFESRWDPWTRFVFSPRHVGPSLRRVEGSVFLCRRYVCCTAVSARVYPHCHDVIWTLCTLCHCTILSKIYTRYTDVSCQCRLVQKVMP